MWITNERICYSSSAAAQQLHQRSNSTFLDSEPERVLNFICWIQLNCQCVLLGFCLDFPLLLLLHAIYDAINVWYIDFASCVEWRRKMRLRWKQYMKYAECDIRCHRKRLLMMFFRPISQCSCRTLFSEIYTLWLDLIRHNWFNFSFWLNWIDMCELTRSTIFSSFFYSRSIL